MLFYFFSIKPETGNILMIFLTKGQISAWYSYKIYSYKKTQKKRVLCQSNVEGERSYDIKCQTT